MPSLSETVAQLEGRRSALLRELTTVEAKLAAISHAIAGERSSGGAAGTTGSIGSRRAKASKVDARVKRAWFERNEIGKLLRKAAKEPRAVAEIVRDLAKMKGYVETLSPDEMRRFQGAAFMAVAQGVKSKLLKRRADGTVVAG